MKHIELSDELWTRLSPIMPKYEYSKKGGRPRLELKKVLEGIIFVKANKLPWKAAPIESGSKTALNDYYRHWARKGLFHALKDLGLLTHPELISLTFEWDAIDAIFNKG